MHHNTERQRLEILKKYQRIEFAFQTYYVEDVARRERNRYTASSSLCQHVWKKQANIFLNFDF